MYVEFEDVNKSIITLNTDAIWAVTTPAETGLSEVLLVGGEKSIKVTCDMAESIRAKLMPFSGR